VSYDPPVSIIVEFFIAPDDEAAVSIAEHGPTGTFEVAEYGNFVPDLWLAELEEAFQERDWDQVAEFGYTAPRILGGVRTLTGESPFAVAMSRELMGALAGADQERLDAAFHRWSLIMAADGEEVDPALAEDLLGELAAMAREADKRGHWLYCWWC
jgi:hypothetical protein